MLGGSMATDQKLLKQVACWWVPHCSMATTTASVNSTIGLPVSKGGYALVRATNKRK